MNKTALYRAGAITILEYLTAPGKKFQEATILKVAFIIKSCVESKFTHGTLTGYVKKGCKCAPCTIRYREYQRAYRARTKGIPDKL